jgi:hypothetical protein
MLVSDLLKTEGDRRVVGTVTATIGEGRFTVTDRQGRDFLVEGNDDFLVGHTVLVKSGIIVKRVKRSTQELHFRV